MHLVQMQPGQLSQLGSTISAQPERNQLILLNASKHSYRSKHRKHTVLKQLDSCIQKRRHYLWLLVLASCKNSLRITIPGQQGILKPFDHHRCCLSLSPSTKQKTRTSNFYSAPLVFYFYFRFYRTRVRSLAMLVTHSLPPSLVFSKLD